MNRIVFHDSPWPEGHEITQLEWCARVKSDGTLWFDLHLVSEDYYAGDPGDTFSTDDPDEDIDDWDSKIVWSNYHNCTLSSTYWGHTGFCVASETQPLDFSLLSTREFAIDPLPPAEDSSQRAFGIYLLGHDGVADHRLRFSGDIAGKCELNWRGKIALEYAGRTSFDYSFHAQSDTLAFSGVMLPDGCSPSEANRTLKRVASNLPELKPTTRNGRHWLITSREDISG
ncbi:hypothetical protein SH528x_004954 [Novipirellula sp. SH528]|uniref:hypothetical protein n=1 Tax=Novipirellula sp. SH528 TaxID=3454466 RepID=UPI003F9F4DE5